MKKIIPSLFLLFTFYVLVFTQKSVKDNLDQPIFLDSDTIKVNKWNNQSNSFKYNLPDSSRFYAEKALELAQNIDFKKGIANAYEVMGVIDFVQSNYKESQNYFNKALNENQALRDSVGMIRIYSYIGKPYAIRGNIQESQKNYDEALLIAKTIKYQKGIADAYSGLGAIALLQNKNEKGLQYCNKALEIYKTLRVSEGIINIYQKLGFIEMNKQSYEKAENYFMEALAISKSSNNKFEAAIAYSYLGTCYMRQKKYEKALDYCNKGLDYFNLMGSIKGLGNTNNVIGLIYFNLGNYDKALTSYEKSSTLLESINDQITRSKIDVNIGLMYDKLGNYEKAIEAYEKALPAFKANNKTDALAATYGNKALVYMKLRDFDKALDNSILALKFNESIPNGNEYHISNSYIGLGSIYDNLGNHEKALENYFRSLKKSTKIIDQGYRDYLQSNAYNGIGRIYSNQDMRDSALYYYNKSLERTNNYLSYFNLDSNQSAEIGNIYSSIGVLFSTKEEYNKAVGFFYKSLDVLKLSKDTNSIINTYFNLGNTFKIFGNIDSALVYFQKAVSISAPGFKPKTLYDNPKITEINWKGYMQLVLRGKAMSLYKRSQEQSKNTDKDLEYALLTNKLAIALIDTLRKEMETATSEEVLLKEKKPAIEGALEVIFALYEKTMEDKYLHEAFTLMEKSRATLLYKALLNSKAKKFANIPDTIIANEYEIKRKINFYQQKIQEEELKEGTADQIKLKLWANKVVNFKQNYQKNITTLEEEFPEYYRLKYKIETINVDSVRKHIIKTPDQCLIEYFVGDTDVYVFTIKENDLNFVKFAKDSLEYQIEQMRKGIYGYWTSDIRCETTNKEDSLFNEFNQKYTKYAHQLYKKILAPLEDLSEKLIIIPDDVLGYLPFEALLMKYPKKSHLFKTHEYVLNRYQISYAYSATLLKQARTASYQDSYREDILIVAPHFEKKSNSFVLRDTIGDCSFISLRNLNSELVHVEKSVNEISEMYKCVVLKDTKASKRDFLSHAGKPWSIIHIGTHGIANDKNPHFSGLYFTELPNAQPKENFLSIAEIYNTKINANMVILGACETGVGELQKGEGIISIGRAFTYAGVRSMTTTLWKVEDQSTSEITTNFYDFLSEEMYKDEALSEAKRSYIYNASNQNASPFFWAGAIPYGDMRPIEIKEKSNWMWILYTILTLITVYLLRISVTKLVNK